MNLQKSSGQKSKKNLAAISPEKLVEEIRKRAYEIHLKQGSTPGSDMANWLKAEQEIKAKYNLS